MTASREIQFSTPPMEKSYGFCSRKRRMVRKTNRYVKTIDGFVKRMGINKKGYRALSIAYSIFGEGKSYRKTEFVKKFIKNTLVIGGSRGVSQRPVAS